jgi:hypothetical protein
MRVRVWYRTEQNRRDHMVNASWKGPKWFSRMLHLGDPRGAGLGRPVLRRLWLPLPLENSRPPPRVGPYRGAGNSERHELLATCYLGTEFCPMREATGRGRRKQHGGRSCWDLFFSSRSKWWEEKLAIILEITAHVTYWAGPTLYQCEK